MKPDYKNWMPKGMVLGTLAGAVGCFGMSALCGCTGLIKNKKAKAAVTDALLLSGIAAGGAALWMTLLYQAFSYDGKRQMSRQIIEGIAQYVTLPEGGVGLDVGCGSGALTIACAKRNPQARFIGIDRWGKEYASFNKPLCEANAAAEGVSNTDFRQGNALKLTFADESFDAVTSNYVYHNIPSSDRQKILLETLRVLKKGGCFAIHDIMSEAKYGDMKAFVEEVRRIVPPQWREFDTLKYQAMEGNQHARERMVEMHLRVALRLALQRAEAFDLDIEETIGDACIGLVIAVDKYNPDANGAFASYASLWILRSIQRRQPTRRPLMYYPAYKKEPLFAAYPLIKQSAYTEYPDLSDAEDIKALLMKEFSLTNEQAEELLVAATPLESFEELFSAYLKNNDVFEKHRFYTEEYDFELLNSGEDINQYIDELSMKEQLAEVLNTLSDRERKVLEMRFGLDNGIEKTLEEIGDHFNVTRERIRQIEAKGIKKLRAPAKKRKLKDFVDLCPSELFSENNNEVK